jgi:hypothetical protein
LSGKCGRWSPSHATYDHKDMKSKSKVDDILVETNEHEAGLYCQWNAEGSIAAVDSDTYYHYSAISIYFAFIWRFSRFLSNLYMPTLICRE